MDLDLAGRRYAIAGGTAGIGFATAAILADGGACVAIGRDAARGDAAAARLAAAPGVVRAFTGDLAASAATQVIGDAVAWLGGLDGIAVTAGPMHRVGPFLNYAEADWDAYFQSTLMLTVRASQASIPYLQANGGGTLVLTLAYSTRNTSPMLAPYVAMKSAVASLTKSLSMEFGADGIRVNCVAPGAVAIEALNGARAAALAQYGPPADAGMSRYMTEAWKMDVALGRVGEPRELGELYAFLLSARAGYLTRAIINQDGGTRYF